MLPALFLSLSWARSWMAGSEVPMIFSAVRTTRCSLSLSSLVADPNQTVMEEQSTDWIMAV